MTLMILSYIYMAWINQNLGARQDVIVRLSQFRPHV